MLYNKKEQAAMFFAFESMHFKVQTINSGEMLESVGLYSDAEAGSILCLFLLWCHCGLE